MAKGFGKSNNKKVSKRQKAYSTWIGKRQKAYSKFIDKLLSSPRDCTNREIAKAMGILETSVSAYDSSGEYLLFLLEVLRETSKSKGNPEVVYPLLTANQDKLDDNFIAVLDK